MMTTQTKVFFAIVTFIVLFSMFSPRNLPNRGRNLRKVQETQLNLSESESEVAKPIVAIPPTTNFKRTPTKPTISFEQMQQIKKQISSNNRINRFRATKLMAEYGDKECIPYLIRALSDDAMAIGMKDYDEPGKVTARYWANYGLVRITGEDFGYVWSASNTNRENSILLWRNWYMKTKKEQSSEAPVHIEQEAPIIQDGKISNNRNASRELDSLIQSFGE